MAKKKKKKIPKVALSRPESKKVELPKQNYSPKPSWRFSTVDLNGPFAWPKGKKKESEIICKLHSFDGMLWSDLLGKQHHSLSPSSLSRVAMKRLKEIEMDDELDNLVSLRLQGKPRIICIRDRNIAKLLWFDQNHEVCPSKKKHT